MHLMKAKNMLILIDEVIDTYNFQIQQNAIADPSMMMSNINLNP